MYAYLCDRVCVYYICVYTYIHCVYIHAHTYTCEDPRGMAAMSKRRNTIDRHVVMKVSGHDM